MPIKMAGRYEPGSEKERAHKLLKEHEIEVDHVYDVARLESGSEEVMFVFSGRAQTAFIEAERVVHVTDGWDVIPPQAGGTWRRGY